MKTYNGHEHKVLHPEFGMYQNVTLDVYGTKHKAKIMDVSLDYVTLAVSYKLVCKSAEHYSGAYTGERIVESVYYEEQEDY